jgi:hypothetical protein
VLILIVPYMVTSHDEWRETEGVHYKLQILSFHDSNKLVIYTITLNII